MLILNLCFAFLNPNLASVAVQFLNRDKIHFLKGTVTETGMRKFDMDLPEDI